MPGKGHNTKIMISISINDKRIEVPEGISILKAAEKAGFHIPNMCMAEGLSHFNSCMICLVKETDTGKVLPSCSLKAKEAMRIITDDEEIHALRKTALELLLSEHVGDCEAPCTIACTAGMNIPLMNRLIEAGEFDHALEVVRRDIILPEVLGYVCPAPCESVCKRKEIDEAVSICLLKRYTGKFGKQSPQVAELKTDKKAAVIGAGPAGLSAAYYLRQSGVPVEVFDAREKAGGNLRYGIEDEKLPKSVLDKEVQFIEDSGVHFKFNKTIGADDFEKLRTEYTAVIIAVGDMPEEMKKWGLESGKNGLRYDKNTYQSNLKNVFAAGNVTRSFKMAIRALGQGKEAAKCAAEYILTGKTEGLHRRFNSKFGRLLPADFSAYLKESEELKRHEPKKGISEGFGLREAVNEAARCLHCDCRKVDNCLLRVYSDEYGAKQRRFSSNELRKPVRKNTEHPQIVFESEKCIKCGICVRTARKNEMTLGLAFIGRGMNTEVASPFESLLSEALGDMADELAEKCPTGALAIREEI